MREDERPDVNNTTLAAQIELLKSGCRAVPWACREFLSLAPRHSVDDVVKAVHRQIHLVGRRQGEYTVEHAIAAIVAGAVLVRGWK